MSCSVALHACVSATHISRHHLLIIENSGSLTLVNILVDLLTDLLIRCNSHSWCILVTKDRDGMVLWHLDGVDVIYTWSKVVSYAQIVGQVYLSILSEIPTIFVTLVFVLTSFVADRWIIVANYWLHTFSICLTLSNLSGLGL